MMMMIAVERCTFNDTHFNGPETVQHRHGYWLDLQTTVYTRSAHWCDFNGPETVQHRHGYWLDLQTIQFTHALLTGVISTAQKRYNTDMVTG